MQKVYCIVERTGLYATYGHRGVVIGTTHIETAYAIRKMILNCHKDNNKWLNDFVNLSDVKGRHTLRLSTRSEFDNYPPRLGICQFPFALEKEDNPFTKLFDLCNCDLFLADDLEYDETRELLTLQGVHLSRAHYMNPKGDSENARRYLDSLYDM